MFQGYDDTEDGDFSLPVIDAKEAARLRAALPAQYAPIDTKNVTEPASKRTKPMVATTSTPKSKAKVDGKVGGKAEPVKAIKPAPAIMPSNTTASSKAKSRGDAAQPSPKAPTEAKPVSQKKRMETPEEESREESPVVERPISVPYPFRFSNSILSRGGTGQHCYINAIVQCLLSLPSVARQIEECAQNYQDYTTQNRFPCGQLFAKLAFMVQQADAIRSQRADLSLQPRINLDALKADAGPIFDTAGQQDAHEYLLHLIGADTGIMPLLGKIFELRIFSRLLCKRCSWKSDVHEVFRELPIDIDPKQPRLGISLSNVFKPCEVPNFRCGNCNTVNTCLKKYNVEEFGTCLVLCARRFDQMRKVHTVIQFGSLTRINTSSTDEPVTFRLYAVCVHLGESMNNGHYVAYVRQHLPEEDAANIPPQKWPWIMCDDDRLEPMTFEQVMKQPAYLLFYERL